MTQIKLRGKPIHTCGNLPEIGSQAPDFQLVNSALAEVSLSSFAGKKKILSIVPSLDTSTCAISTEKFNEKAKTLENTVVLVISADLPFAQTRFCGSKNLKTVIPLSSFRSSFGQDYGVALIDGPLRGLMARAIVVLDAGDKVLHTALVGELSHEPDYDRVLEGLE